MPFAKHLGMLTTRLGSLAALALATLLPACAAEQSEDMEEASAVARAPHLRHPVILVAGFSAGPSQWNFVGVRDALEKDGVVVTEAFLPPFAPSPVRARELVPVIEKTRALCRVSVSCDASKVNIIAHSMGGVDARLAISELGQAEQVASLTTIASPHRGTAVADVGRGLAKGPVPDVLDSLANLWGRRIAEEDARKGTDLGEVLVGLSTSGSAEFNRTHPDAPGVYYQSYAGVSNPFSFDHATDTSDCEGKIVGHPDNGDWLDKRMLIMHTILAGNDRTPNDGMVTVDSAKWGNFRGCLFADHADEVGAGADPSPDSRTGFEPTIFYRDVVRDLANRGF